MEYVELLKKYGFSDKDIQRIIQKRGKTAPSTAEEHINELQKFFNLSNTELVQFINDAPNLIGADIMSEALTSVKSKTEYYKKTFGLSDESTKKFVCAFPALLTYDITDKTAEGNENYVSSHSKGPNDTTVPEKIRFFKKILMLSDKEVLKVIKKFPMLLGYDIYSNEPTSILSKVNFYKDLLGFDDAEVANFIRKLPQLLSYDTGTSEESKKNPSSIITKYDFYKKTFNLTDSQASYMIKQLPSLLSYDTVSESPKSVKGKLAFYQKKLGLTDEELRKFIFAVPCALGYDTISTMPSSVSAKIDRLLEIGTVEDIKKNPRCLCLPAQKVKVRAMLIADIDNNPIASNNLMIREQKLYARRCYLASHKIPITWTELFRNEGNFQSVNNISSDSLMNIYPLTDEALKEIEEAYNKLGKRPLHLDESERVAILGDEE